jgi:predicted nucleotidyltransferase
LVHPLQELFLKGKRVLHESKVKNILSQVIALANPRRVVLFGSLARGQNNVNDVDLLVVVADDANVREISARLQRGVRRGGIALDLLVVTESGVAECSGDPSSVVFYALKEGKELHVA